MSRLNWQTRSCNFGLYEDLILSLEFAHMPRPMAIAYVVCSVVWLTGHRHHL